MHIPQSKHWSWWNIQWRSFCCNAPIIYDLPRTRMFILTGIQFTSSLICMECDLPVGSREDNETRHNTLGDGVRDGWSDLVDALIILRP